eukprot:3784637-Prymnesium_polylepis.1
MQLRVERAGGAALSGTLEDVGQECERRGGKVAQDSGVARWGGGRRRAQGDGEVVDVDGHQLVGGVVAQPHSQWEAARETLVRWEEVVQHLTLVPFGDEARRPDTLAQKTPPAPWWLLRSRRSACAVHRALHPTESTSRPRPKI